MYRSLLSQKYVQSVEKGDDIQTHILHAHNDVTVILSSVYQDKEQLTWEHAWYQFTS